MLGKRRQQLELAVGQVNDHLVWIVELAGQRIEPPALEVSVAALKADRRFATATATAAAAAALTAQDGAHARQQFARLAGLAR